MEGILLKFYTHDSAKHQGKLIFEWLLESAKKQNLEGGTVVRAMAGFGRHHTIHEEHFFELGGNLPMEVNFITSTEKANQFLETLKKENLKLFYVKVPVQYDLL